MNMGSRYSMTMYALVFEVSEVHLWGLDAGQRLRRQLNEITKASNGESEQIHWVEQAGDLPASGRVLLFNGSFVFENRTIKGVLDRPGSVLQYEGETAAAFVDVAQAAIVIDAMRKPESKLPDDMTLISTDDLKAFDSTLRRSTKPLLEPVSPRRKAELENKLYGNAYRGITDLVTKFVWPRPAKQAVHVCASLGMTPNMVTSLGLLLVIAASYLFYHGYYAWGLLAGWIMTYLDTVDGKLARVTINSSKFGHLVRSPDRPDPPAGLVHHLGWIPAWL